MEFHVLGPLQVIEGSREIEIPAGRHRALLATLLLRPNQVVPTSELVTHLWGGDPPRDARATAQTYVGRLRGILGSCAIHTRPGGYELPVTTDQLDLARFDDLLQQARDADQPEQEAALLADALQLWRGPALANVPSDALHRFEVPALTERRLRAIERRLHLDLATGQHADLVVELRTLVAEHPLRERFWGQLMTALAGSGCHAAALRVYQDLRSRLAEELGTDPGPELQELHRAILRGGAPAAGPARGPTPARRPPAQLPPEVTAFTGRTTVVRQLDALLPAQDAAPPPAVVIVVLDGTAGIGKTALAVRWAHRVRDRFPDGQLYVNLRGYATDAPMRPVEALAGFLPALGVPADQVPAEPEPATALYRSLLADKRVLVVLDNAADPDQVRPLLPAGSGSLVLVTSRDRLSGLVARDGAHRLPVDVVSPEEAHALLARLLGAARVRAEPAAAAAVAELCGHLPLALRIAAAKLAAYPRFGLAAYVAQLRDTDRMAALTVAGDEAATVPAAFDLSYRRLPEPAQRLFRRAGLAPGPELTTEAVAALAGVTPGQAAPLLQQVAAAHLLEQPSFDRYAFHDLVRAYAATRARDEDTRAERDTAVARLFAYYLQTADAAARLLCPQLLRLPMPSAPEPDPVFGADHARALHWLDTERTNLVACITLAARHGPHPAAWLLADALRGYFFMRSSSVDWQTAGNTALAAATTAGDQRAQAAAHLSLANFWYRQRRRYPRAVEHYQKALELTRASGWLDGQAATLGNLGALYLESGPLGRATEDIGAALALFARSGRRQGQATALSDLGQAYLRMGRLAEAAEHAARALVMNHQVGSGNGAAISHGVLGEVDHAAGRLDAAAEHFTQARDLFRTVGNQVGECQSLRHLAAVHHDAGHHTRALGHARRAVRLAHHIDTPAVAVESLDTLGDVQLGLWQRRHARGSFRRATELASRVDRSDLLAEALVSLARAHRHLGEREPARTRLRQALVTIRTNGYRPLEGDALAVLADLQLHTGGGAGSAITSAKQALAIYRETRHRLGEARTLVVLAHTYPRAARPAAFTQHWQQALALFTELGIPVPRSGPPPAVLHRPARPGWAYRRRVC